MMMQNNEGLIRQRMSERAREGKLSCAAALALAEELGVSPATIGEYADEMKIRLVECQLGLFGYEPEKKIVRPLEKVPDEVRAAVMKRLEDDCLSCRQTFALAAHLGTRKMDVSGACDALGIKIKPCQLGAF